MCGVSDEYHASQRPPPSSAAGPPPSIPQPNDDDLFRILIATDNHLGYAEKDPVRGQDAMNTFREILEIARDQDVDFILLAGDLFHENRPSRTCLHQTIALLREFTFGDKPVSFELLSDPMDGARPNYSFPAINYEDPNLNVGIPVFSIHGNHDDPQGSGAEGALCALDVLSVAGVINYFGKVDLPSGDNKSDESSTGAVNIKPILLRKGATHLGLYGVGNIKDVRFHYQLRSNGVKMFMPKDGDIAADDWFNLLLIHQNRVKHGPQQSVPEGMFDDSIKLVIWGHEHDCRIWPEQVEGKPYHITQPGSSVATSLAHGEALPKHVGILHVQRDLFQIAEIPLKTVRPFEIDEVELAREAEMDPKVTLEDKDSITALLRDKVEELIHKARLNWEATHDAETEEMKLPLIRLRVETTGAKEMTNPVRFGQDFVGRVANPRDILQYHRKKVTTRKTANNPDLPDHDVMDDDDEDGDQAFLTTSDRLAKIRMGKLVQQYLQAQNLEVLGEEGLEEAVMRFVEKDDKDSIKDFVGDELKRLKKQAQDRATRIDDDNYEEFFVEAKENRKEYQAANPRETRSADKKGKKKKAQNSDIDSMAEDSMMEESEDEPAPKRGGTGARGGKAATTASKEASKGKGRQALFDPGSDSDVEALDDDDVSMASGDGSRSPRKAPSRAAASSRQTASTRGTAKKATTTSRTVSTRAASTRATTTTRGARAAASSKSQPRQTQLSFAKGRGSKLVTSDSD